MAKRGVKRKAPTRSSKRVKKGPETPLDVDRFSKLPDPIIQLILSFLPTVDVVRTSLLSKRWRYMWYVVPTLRFSDKTTAFGSPRGPKIFYKYVDNCLKHRKRGMSSIADLVITSFKLEMDYYEESDALLDKWLGFAVESNVKELSLYLDPYPYSHDEDSFAYYCLPETVVNAGCLTILELMSVDLTTSSYTYSLPSLKTLSLIDVEFGDGVLDKLMVGCPSLEKLLLEDCGFLYIARFQSLSLKFLEIKCIEEISSVQVEATNLESCVLVDISCDKINISACKAIRNLSLTRVPRITDQVLEDLIPKLPLLENLTLSRCDKLQHFKISSQHLKSFNLNNSFKDEVTVTIESAPNLASFCYRGNMNFRISMESPNSLNGDFLIDKRPENYDGNWYINLMNFLLNLKCSWNIVSLHVSSDEALILPENLRRICRSPLLNWKHLKVISSCKQNRESELRDALFWISPSLETLSINRLQIKRRFKF